jgi:anaerobic magnesium-protoporphyrin IX monomethyl ester cyclase
MRPNILFVNLPYIPIEFLGEDSPGKSILQGSPLTMPMGILCISSYLKEHNDVGHVSLLDYRLYLGNLKNYSSLEEFFLEEARKNLPYTPDIIAISLVFSLSHALFEIAVRKLKQLWPSAVTVIGGFHATNAARFLIINESVDYVLRGEGEIGFSKFVHQYAKGRPIDVQGVYCRENFKNDHQLLLATPVKDLDAMPLPDWDLLDMERYMTEGRRRTYGEKGGLARAATILTTRGCPFKCTFCSNHTVHGYKVRTRSAESVTHEIETLWKRYGVTLFIPEDDLFTANKKRLLSVLEALRGLNIPGFELQLGNGLSVDEIDEDILDALMNVGVRSTTIAIESGSEYVQKHIIKKNVNLRKAKDVVTWCHGRDLIVRAYIIFGFPNETKELMNETLQYMHDLGADWYVINIAQPLIGTEMYDTFLKRGCFMEGVDAWTQNLSHKRQFDTDEISGAELTEFAYRTNLEVNFLKNVNLRNGNYERAIKLFNDMAHLYPFHIFAWYGLYLAYEGKNDVVQSSKALQRMKELIATDSRAREMSENYGYLMKVDDRRVN